ncbi:MAG: S53 family peptidase [Vulcanimicrobiaceae bacterium]
MDHDRLIPIPGTHRLTWPGTTRADDISSDADILLTAWLRPRVGGELDVALAHTLAMTAPAARTYQDRGELLRRTTCDPEDVETLRAYCRPFGVEIVETHWRSVVLRGSIPELIKAFGATVAIYEAPDKRRFRHRSESLHAPSAIAQMLRGPFGIHQWPRSRPLGALHGETVPLTGSQIAQRYQFPDADGSGQTVGILQLRGTFQPDDFTKCMHFQGVTATMPVVKRVDNAELTHGIVTEKDVESAIDTQIVGALAPGAQIVIYDAPDDERGVLDAIRTAIFDEEYSPSILSISFGFPEHLWTPVALSVLDELFIAAALLGISVFCAAGDNGAELDYDGKPHVLAPASSPFAQACGGTQLGADSSEVAWDKSGGGFSERSGVPAWQDVAKAAADAYGAAPGRGVPDFSAQVRPGYTVFLEGRLFAMGGTSAVAPAWSALTARLNQRLGHRIGFFAPLLYACTSNKPLRDITQGGNDHYQAAAGWSPCTGLGVPVGEALERALQ